MKALDCGHPSACIIGGTCGWCRAVKEAEQDITDVLADLTACAQKEEAALDRAESAEAAQAVLAAALQTIKNIIGDGAESLGERRRMAIVYYVDRALSPGAGVRGLVDAVANLLSPPWLLTPAGWDAYDWQKCVSTARKALAHFQSGEGR